MGKDLHVTGRERDRKKEKNEKREALFVSDGKIKLELFTKFVRLSV